MAYRILSPRVIELRNDIRNLDSILGRGGLSTMEHLSLSKMRRRWIEQLEELDPESVAEDQVTPIAS